MRAVVQVVLSASVSVDAVVVALVDRPGLVVLLGVTHTDTEADARRLADKIWELRILDDENSASDLDAPVLVVSQFTLYGETNKGRRPTWSNCRPGPRGRAAGRGVLRRAASQGRRRRDRGLRGGHARVTRQRRTANAGPRQLSGPQWPRKTATPVRIKMTRSIASDQFST